MMIEALEETGYTVSWKILNTRDYGVPQNRERVFIVGVHQSMKQKFKFPEPTELENVLEYVDWSDIRVQALPPYAKNKNITKSIHRDSVFIDIAFYRKNQFKPDAYRWSSCILTSGNLWNFMMGRYASMKELLMLQGFPPTFNQVVSDTQLKKQIGNSMSVNVLEAILEALLRLIKNGISK
jgi:DNA (cytosine-5)-methyltransferase 1